MTRPSPALRTVESRRLKPPTKSGWRTMASQIQSWSLSAYQPGVDLGKFRDGVGNGRQAATVFGDAQGLPVLAQVGAELFHVGVKDFVGGQGVAGPVPTFHPTTSQDGCVLSRAGVKPAPRATDLPAKLDQRNVQRGQHQGPFGFVQQRLRCCNVFGVPVVEATAMAFCSQEQSASSSVNAFNMKGFIIERP